MMGRMGFGELWIKWMEVVMLNSHLSVLVNGILIMEFRVDRSLRQGGPFSSFLFVLVAECLSWLVRIASEVGGFSGINIKSVCKVDIKGYENI